MSNSLFIHHVFSNISMGFVAETLQSNGYGTVERIEWTPKVSSLGFDYRSCFVFFDKLCDTPLSVKTRSILTCSKKTVLYYEPHIYWNISPNTSEICNYRANIHMDLEVLVPIDTSIASIMNVFQGLDLGKIHSVELIPDLYQGFNDDVVITRKKNAYVTSDSYWWNNNVYSKNILARIHYDYWYRTIDAVKFQSEIFEDPNNKYLSVQISDNIVWKIYVSTEKPMILPGNNPFIWLNGRKGAELYDITNPINAFEDKPNGSSFDSEDDVPEDIEFISELESIKKASIDNIVNEILKRHMNDYCRIVSSSAKLNDIPHTDITQFGYDASALEMLNESRPELRIHNRMPPCGFDTNPWRIIKIR